MAASFEIFREIEGSSLYPFSNTGYILQNQILPKQVLNNLTNAYKKGGINNKLYSLLNQLFSKYNAAINNENSINELYYFITQSAHAQHSLPSQNNMSTKVYNSLIITNFIEYIYQIIAYLYVNNYINGSVYNFFINSMIPNINQLISNFNIKNYTRGDISNYLNNDYNNCVAQVNNMGYIGSNICNYFIGGGNPLELELNNSIYIQQQNPYMPIQRPRLIQNLSEHRQGSSLMQRPNLMFMHQKFDEDSYNTCAYNAFQNNASDTECNRYLDKILLQNNI